MIRGYLENCLGEIEDKLFEKACLFASSNIIVCNIKKKEKTSLEDALSEIAQAYIFLDGIKKLNTERKRELSLK